MNNNHCEKGKNCKKHNHFKIDRNEKTNKFFITIVFLLGVFVAITSLISISAINTEYEWFNFGVLIKKPSASLVISSDKEHYQIGEDVTIKVSIVSNNEVAGTDVFLSYDPSFLQLKKANPDESTPSKTYLITKSSVFDIFPYGGVVDNQGRRVLSFSALSEPSLKRFQGKGEVVSLKFETLNDGISPIDIIFKPNSTLDSNVAHRGNDILERVQGVNILVK